MAGLVQEADRTVFLILDNLPVHRARLVRNWLAERTAKIEVFHLPPYSPDEGLNADLKQAVTCKPPARSKRDLKRTLISHMRSPSKRPTRRRQVLGKQLRPAHAMAAQRHSATARLAPRQLTGHAAT